MKNRVFFRNAAIYRLLPGVTLPLLEESLSKRVFKPCGASEAQSMGWFSQWGTESLAGAFIDNQVLLSLKVESKAVPSSLIAEEVAKRVAQIAQEEEGRVVGRKEFRELRERVAEGLLSRALSSFKVIHAWVDLRDRWFVVDASSPKAADMVLEAFIGCVDVKAVTPLQSIVAPDTAMREWLATGNAPESFSVDMDCDLRGVGKQVVKLMHHRLDTPEVTQHLEQGKCPVSLGMTFKGRVSFVLTDKAWLRKLSILDVAVEEHEASAAAPGDDGDRNSKNNSSLEMVLSDVCLMGGELRALLPALVRTLGGEEGEGEE